MNSVVLIGKVTSINQKDNSFTLSVERNHRNEIGEYPTDSFLCRPWKGMNTYLSTYLNADDILVIKGQIEKNDNSFEVMVDQFSIIHRPNKKITTWHLFMVKYSVELI